jgi:hypothetical protein
MRWLTALPNAAVWLLVLPVTLLFCVLEHLADLGVVGGQI